MVAQRARARARRASPPLRGNPSLDARRRSHRSMWLLVEIGAMAILLSELSAFLDDEEATDGRQRSASSPRCPSLDEKTKESKARSATSSSLTTLLYEALEEATSGVRDLIGAVNDFLHPVIDRIAMPRRIADWPPAHHVTWCRGSSRAGSVALLVRTSSCPPSTSPSSFSHRAARARPPHRDAPPRSHAARATPAQRSSWWWWRRRWRRSSLTPTAGFSGRPGRVGWIVR